MDFFQHQDRSRRKSRWLVGAFLVAVLAIVAVVDLAAVLFIGESGLPERTFSGLLAANARLIAFVSLATLLAIFGASLFRIAQLRDGGPAVARALGAVEVPDNPDDFRLRRLRNVVEETALASGLPVPELFVMEQEQGINACAAGHSPSDAAIAVTRGTLERLNRNELQGVIAHEFSHVANGDMRLSLRLMGWIFGILFLAMAGRAILRAGVHGGSRRKGSGLALVGLTLFVIGYIGVFAGRVIKAAVSRERERLADASAVQFTRDTGGLAGALKKIGGFEPGSRLQHADAEEVSHMLFAPGLASRLLATHPPLMERIRALDPTFTAADYARIDWTDDGAPEPEASARFAPAGPVPASQLARSARRPESVPTGAGRALRRGIPDALYREAHRDQGAMRVVAALLLSEQAQVRAAQWPVLEDWLGADATRAVEALAEEMAGLPAQLRMPLVQIAWPRLRHRPRDELVELGRAVERLIRADRQVTVFEYALSRVVRVLLRDLGDSRERRVARLAGCRVELADLFSVLADAGHEGRLEAMRAYEAGLSRILPLKRPEYRPPAHWQVALDRALDRLDALPAVIKGELIEALAETVSHDARLVAGEVELMRAIGASLHCPIPALQEAKTS